MTAKLEPQSNCIRIDYIVRGQLVGREFTRLTGTQAERDARGVAKTVYGYSGRVKVVWR